mgnify:FL=1
MFRNLGFWLVLLTLTGGGLPAFASTEESPLVLVRPAMSIANPENAWLLGVVRAGSRLVAVGENGLILLSDNDGQNWHQAVVPVSVMLTGVAFANETTGWAIGHLGVVLKTTDAGEHWTLQLDGIQAAALVLEQAREHAIPGAEKSLAVRRAELLVDDGPDKPFLALEVRSRQEVLILGAYGYALQTTDGGEHWTSVSRQFENPMGMHYYGLAHHGNHRFVVGERGLLLRSELSTPFGALSQPYDGTLFGSVITGHGDVVAFGLRGNIVCSGDDGDHWKHIDSPVEASIQAGTRLLDGRVLLVAENGQMLTGRDCDSPFTLMNRRSIPAADLVQISRDQIVVVGPSGTQVINFANGKL